MSVLNLHLSVDLQQKEGECDLSITSSPRKYVKLVYRKNVVMVTLTTSIMFPLLTCIHFWVWRILRRWSACAPIAYEVIWDCRKFEKHCASIIFMWYLRSCLNTGPNTSWKLSFKTYHLHLEHAHHRSEIKILKKHNQFKMTETTTPSKYLFRVHRSTKHIKHVFSPLPDKFQCLSTRNTLYAER
jgi:hypothetical protein